MQPITITYRQKHDYLDFPVDTDSQIYVSQISYQFLIVGKQL